MYGAAPRTHHPCITTSPEGIDIHVPVETALDGAVPVAPQAWRMGHDLWSIGPNASARRRFPSLSASVWAAIEAGRARWTFQMPDGTLRVFPLSLRPDPWAPPGMVAGCTP